MLDYILGAFLVILLIPATLLLWLVIIQTFVDVKDKIKEYTEKRK